ncbi:MAG: radical SAM protein [Candidatus Micrarchaeaceae archaeon]
MYVTKLLGLAFTALKSNVVELDRPYKLNFAITYWCNSRCLTCNIWQLRPKGELSLGEIEKFAKENPYFKWIELTGGEVFMRNDLVDIARAFANNSKKLYILTMPTNSLCSHALMEKRLREILELGIPRIAITVSLDGYRELHDKVRGVPGNFDKAIDTFRMLQRLKKEYNNLFFVFGYTMSIFNQGKLADTINAVMKEIPDVTYNDFHINLGQISDNYYGNSNLDIKANNDKAAEEINWLLGKRRAGFDAIQVIESAFLRNLARYARTGKSPMKSRSMEASVFMDSYGRVYPSIMWNKEIGNIRNTGYSLEPLIKSEAANSVRNDIAEGKEPSQWTSCEAYQSLVGNIPRLIR